MEETKPAANASIRMGELSVAGNGEQLRTLLGSCIGLALHDRRHRIGGLAHIVLPQARGTSALLGKFADTAIPALIEQMEKLVVGKLNLRAKMIGGASMFTATKASMIGQQNIEASERILGEMGIPIVGSQCGGEKGRRVTLDAATGLIIVEIVGADPIELHDRPRRRRHTDVLLGCSPQWHDH